MKGGVHFVDSTNNFGARIGVLYLTILVGYNKIRIYQTEFGAHKLGRIHLYLQPMLRLTPKIAVVMTACLLGMNLMAGAAFAATSCRPSMCCSHPIPMQMDHCGPMSHLALPFMKCSDACNNLMCGPLNDPLQDVNAVNPSSEQGYYYVFHPGMHPFGSSFVEVAIPGVKHPTRIEPSSNLIPLYITHLSLII